MDGSNQAIKLGGRAFFLLGLLSEATAATLSQSFTTILSLTTTAKPSIHTHGSLKCLDWCGSFWLADARYSAWLSMQLYSIARLWHLGVLAYTLIPKTLWQQHHRL